MMAGAARLSPSRRPNLRDGRGLRAGLLTSPRGPRDVALTGIPGGFSNPCPGESDVAEGGIPCICAGAATGAINNRSVAGKKRSELESDFLRSTGIMILLVETPGGV